MSTAPSRTTSESLRALAEDKTLEQLQQTLTRFNPFEVLRLAQMEIRHSNVLAWLLDSRESHGLGDTFAQAWFERIGADSLGGPNPLSQVLNQAGSNRVLNCRREWHNHDGSTRKADILVEVRSGAATLAVICIENKIRHTQSEDQLSDYRKMVERAYPSVGEKFYFLLSSNREVADDPNFRSACYSSVVKCLEPILAENSCSAPSPDVHAFLTHYHTTIKRYLMNDSLEMKLALEINRKYRRALDYISSVRPDERADLVQRILQDLVSNKDELRIVPLRVGDGLIRFIPNQWETPSNRDPESSDWRKVFCQLELCKGSSLPILIATLLSSDEKGHFLSAEEALHEAAANKNFPHAQSKPIKAGQWYQFFRVPADNISIADLPNEDLASLAEHILLWLKSMILSEDFSKMTEAVEQILANEGKKSTLQNRLQA